MGLTLVGCGVYETWNLLAHAATTLSMETGTANANFPLSFLKDGNQAKPFRAAADVTDLAIKANLGSAKLGELLTIHGHNLTTGITFIELRYAAADNYAGSALLAKIVPLYKRSSMYIWVPGGISRQWFWVVFKGTNGGSPIWIGEASLSSPLRLTAKVRHPMRVEHQELHVRHGTPAGRKSVFERTAWASRYVAAGFMGTLAARDQVVDDVYRANRGDLRPVVFIPRAPSALVTGGSGEQTFQATENVVVFGHFDPPELVQDEFAPALSKWTIGVQEDGFNEPMA